ncbi:MAG TPA: type II toxin-antitoxin system RelE/ParE family toxin [Anaerolineae bacterium]|nr:type II toxin-antitoxin system RelE/ParE family toxin [Anaerolineae bacterium]
MYNVRITKHALKDIENLPKGYARLISQHIDGLAANPRPPNSKRLKGDKDYSLRVGVYRILYDIDDPSKIVTIYRVRHRREVYR